MDMKMRKRYELCSEFTYKWPYMIYSKYTLLFWDVSWGLGVEKEKEKFPWVLGKGWAPGYGGGGMDSSC